MTLKRGLAMLAVFATVAGTAVVAWGQSYPTRRVTLVAPYAPGGPTDVVARSVAAEVEKGWKQPFIIENRPGAGGLLGTEYVARQSPDGYTLLLQGGVPFTVKLFVKAPTFDPADLRPVASLVQSNYMIVTNPAVGPKDLKEFVTLAKGKGKALNYGMIPFTTYELDYLVFQRLVGIDMTAIPYQSAAPIITAVLRNDVQFYFGILGLVGPQVIDGKMVGLAYLGRERHPRYPTVPTAREQGIDFGAGFGLGIVAHAKTPDDVFNKLGRDLVVALKQPEVIARLNAAGYDVPAAPLDWGKEIAADMKNYLEVTKAINYQPQ